MPKYKGTQKKRNRWYYWILNNRTKKLEWYGGFDTAEKAYRGRIKKLNDIQFQSLF
ncbi:hypothetical protein ES703_121559 [subsurface metagenome]